MIIHRLGARKTIRASSDYFTGVVHQDPIVDAPAPASLRSIRVSFEPGARTAWHTHPLGQTIYITDGIGLVQRDGGPVQEVRPGDVVFFEPNERHWHGASPDVAMVHIAMQEAKDGKHVEWSEHVTDAEYRATPQR
ncbi:MAG TPA: cupin domain-containing protein [Beijerinckiaceae bacterium]|jgi:quercetin dioxygenase-like cupin family protein